MKPGLLQRGPMRRRLRILRRRREAMLLDVGALVLEMHRHGRFLPDGLARRAAEVVGTDAELRALSRALEAGDGSPDLIAAGVAGNCPDCGALHTIGSAFCSQCGANLGGSGLLPKKAALGQAPEVKGVAPLPRRPVAVAPRPAERPVAAETQTAVAEPPEPPPEPSPEPPPEPPRKPSRPPASAGSSPPFDARARATRVRQRLNEPSRRPAQTLPAGLLAGIAAGVVVIGLGIVVLSSGDGDAGTQEPDRAAEAPRPGEREPRPDDAPVTPVPGTSGGGGDAADPAVALEPVESVSASDYDPVGDNQEHPEAAPLAVDGDAATSWPTEEYEAGTLQKDGVGLYLEPADALAARALDLESTTPGFDVTIYGAQGAEPPASLTDGWNEIASEEGVGRERRIELDAAGNEFAYYLIWITRIPQDEGKVEIVEAQLLR